MVGKSVRYELHGEKPTASKGTFFRRCRWGWKAIAELCKALAPEEARPCKDWQGKEGYGLNGPQALELAAKLDALLATGTVTKYLRDRDLGTEDDVCAFVAFLKASGGFSIT